MNNGAAISVRHLGHISFGIAVGGLFLVGALLHFGVLDGLLWRVILVGFEAATVGALAEWFAVTAMFRRVPIPVLSRHTDILAKNKERITRAVEGMVAEKFFNKANVDKLLGEFSASQKLLDHLEKDDNIGNAIRDILDDMTPFLNSLQLSEFLAGEVRGAGKDRDVPAFFVDWLPKVVSQGQHQRVLSLVIDVVRESLKKDDIRDLFKRGLEEVGQHYKDKSWWKAFAGWSLEKTGAVEYSELADSALCKLDNLLRQVEAPSSEARKLLDERLLRVAEQLRIGNPAYTKAVATIASAIFEYDKLPQLIQTILIRLGKQIKKQSLRPDSELMRWLSGRIRQLFYEFRINADRRAKLDLWVRGRIKENVKPERLGGIVHEYLDNMTIQDFRTLIESRVGDDLQWIRLNGALIGGLVGIIIGVVKCFPF